MIANDGNMEKSQRDWIPLILKLYSLMNRPVSLPLTSLWFTKKTSNHIKYFVFPFLLILTQKMNNFIRARYVQQCEDSAVSTRILPPESNLSTRNLSYFFGLLIKVCSDFFSKCIGHSPLMKTSSWTNQMHLSLILSNSMKSHIKMESSSKISEDHQVKGETEL